MKKTARKPAKSKRASRPAAVARKTTAAAKLTPSKTKDHDAAHSGVSLSKGKTKPSTSGAADTASAGREYPAAVYEDNRRS